MSTLVAPQISFQFDFENPDQWNAHSRRDFIENLSEEFQKISAQVLEEAGKKSGFEFDAEQKVGRVHTPWMDERHTRVVFQPSVPSALVQQATDATKLEHAQFQQSWVGRATLWLMNKISSDQGVKEVQNNLLEQKLNMVASNWTAHLVDPIIRKLGGWVAQYGQDGVDIQVITPQKTIKLKIQSFPVQ